MINFKTEILMRPNYRDGSITNLYECQNCNYDLTKNKSDHALISYGVCPNCDADHNSLKSFKEVGLVFKPTLRQNPIRSLQRTKQIDFTKFNNQRYL